MGELARMFGMNVNDSYDDKLCLERLNAQIERGIRLLKEVEELNTQVEQYEDDRSISIKKHEEHCIDFYNKLDDLSDCKAKILALFSNYLSIVRKGVGSSEEDIVKILGYHRSYPYGYRKSSDTRSVEKFNKLKQDYAEDQGIEMLRIS